MNKCMTKTKILRFAEEGLIKHLSISEALAKDYIEKSKHEQAIDRAPDIIAHYTQEQLVAYIMGI